MSRGNKWIALDKYLTQEFKYIRREFSMIEAMFSYSSDVDCGTEVSISGYSRIWGWSRNKVRKFLKGIRTDQGHIRDRKRTGRGHPIHFIDNALMTKKDTKRTDKGQIKDRSGTPSLNPNPNPNPKTTDIDEPKGTPTKICPQIKIRNLYNEILPELPKCKVTNKTVESMVRTRWKEEPERQSLSWWHNYFTDIRQSDFLMGKVNGNHFTATFEWLVRPTNMSKVLNGNYKNKGQKEWNNF